ncbi:MAG: aminodeoxychorismate/anthranilate synthase component II [Myxococcota bacterium]
MILLIDNYDSFAYNLVQYFGELGVEVTVARNDALTLEQIEALSPAGIVISPGPGRPEQAGISEAVIRRQGPVRPILGVCLCHQAIAQVYGGKIVAAARLMHGRTDAIHHEEAGVFAGLPSPFTATRYHSLIVEREAVPDILEVTAWTEAGEVMGLRHRSHPVEGVQFHPESFLSEHGHRILRAFVERTRAPEPRGAVAE